MSNCGSKPCGCADVGLTTPAPCNTFNCPKPNPCSETFDSCCVIYTGPTIVNANINTGDRLCDIIQKLVIYSDSGTIPAACLDPLNCNGSLINFAITAVTTNSATVSWDFPPCQTVPGYIVEYKDLSSPTWTLSSVIPANTNTYTVLALASSSSYYVRVRTSTAVSSPCYSVTLLINTK